MPEQIRDGTGTGKLWKINADNKAEVTAVVQTEEAAAAEAGYAFSISTGIVTLNSTNPHLLLYLQNTDADLEMRVWVVNFSWNGGSTNYNRTMRWSLVLNPNVPTANYTLTPPGNLNFTSGNVANAVGYKWDGVGDGMTYTGGIGGIVEHIFGQGVTPIEQHGIPIIGLGTVTGFIITGDEIGDVSIGLRFFYK